MIAQQRQFILKAAVVLAAGWVIAISGYQLAFHSRPSLEKLRRHIAATDLAPLSGDRRRAALADLVTRLDRMPAEEQHLARLEQPWTRWFPILTPHQRDNLIEDTLPADADNLLTAFDFLPAELQNRGLTEALKRLQTDQAKLAVNPMIPPVTGDLVTNLEAGGLNEYFASATVTEKTQIAPLLEELHQLMETGDLARRQFHR